MKTTAVALALLTVTLIAGEAAYEDGKFGKARKISPPDRPFVPEGTEEEDEDVDEGDEYAGEDEEIEANGDVWEANRSAIVQMPRKAQPLKYEKFSRDNPLINFDKLVFVKRRTYHSSHFYTDFIDGCGRNGGNISVLDLETGKVTDLLPPSLQKGIIGRYDLHFSAKKIVFDYKKAKKEGFRIYEIDIDPKKGIAVGEPRQLTVRPDDEDARIKKYDNSDNGGTARMYYHQTDDMHPCYLPDGGIAFVSTRCEYGTLCDAPDHLTTAIMYRMEGDGSKMRPLSNSALSEFAPTMMEDGRILYTRWEYVDKGQLGVKCLWAMYPDGSSSSEIYGNDIRFPPTMIHGRQIPGKPHLVSFLGTPHYPQSGIGTVILVDLTKNIRTREPMRYITPHVDIRQEPGWNHCENGRWRRHENGPLYMDPYPLTEKDYLVAHNPDKKWSDPTAYGLYLINDAGRHELIHKESETSCWQPMPLVKRKTPPRSPGRLDSRLAKQGLAECFVQDVHFGMENVKKGEVKYLRVMEQLPRPWDCRQFWGDVGHTDMVGGPALSVRVMWGVVPVEEDGSAHFYVPAERNIYLQALDENYWELQRERTYVNYMPGEKRSCVGCHETPNDTPPPMTKTPIAMKKRAVMPGPQPGDKTGKQVMHFESYIQPILDKHCVSCHNGDKEFELRGLPHGAYSESWQNLHDRDCVPTYGEASDWDGTEYAPAKSIGSHRSRLFAALKEKQHKDLKLSEAEMVRFATWIDASGPFYGSYWGRHDARHKRHPKYRPVPTFEEAISTVCPYPMDER